MAKISFDVFFYIGNGGVWWSLEDYFYIIIVSFNIFIMEHKLFKAIMVLY